MKDKYQCDICGQLYSFEEVVIVGTKSACKECCDEPPMSQHQMDIEGYSHE